MSGKSPDLKFAAWRIPAAWKAVVPGRRFGRKARLLRCGADAVQHGRRALQREVRLIDSTCRLPADDDASRVPSRPLKCCESRVQAVPVVAMTQGKARRWAAACAAVLMRGAPWPTALTDSRRSRLRVCPSAALRERRCMIATRPCLPRPTPSRSTRKVSLATTFHRVARNCTGFHRIVTVVAERPSQVVDITATWSRWHSRGHRFDPG